MVGVGFGFGVEEGDSHFVCLVNGGSREGRGVY